ncbi:MAG: DUF448 domain-containing protein [Nitriliruptorales bacterium]|nr:DUF448 domain-containing protein [Nitriliruptorales bacterium]
MVSVPTRSCLACRRRQSKSSLCRLTIAGGTVVLDPPATMPGRGAYLCHRRSCLDAALNRGAARLLRALRADGGGTTVDEQAIRAAHGSNTDAARGTRPRPGAGVE